MARKKNTWLWIGGAALLIGGGTWWYLSRKKKEEEEPKALAPTNFHVISTQEEAGPVVLQPITDPVVTVWARKPFESTLINEIRARAEANPGIQIYFFREAVMATGAAENINIVVAGGRDGQRLYLDQIGESDAPLAEALAAFDAAAETVTQPSLGAYDAASTLGELAKAYKIVKLIPPEADPGLAP